MFTALEMNDISANEFFRFESFLGDLYAFSVQGLGAVITQRITFRRLVTSPPPCVSVFIATDLSAHNVPFQ